LPQLLFLRPTSPNCFFLAMLIHVIKNIVRSVLFLFKTENFAVF
jgi:hypothetical protein